MHPIDEVIQLRRRVAILQKTIDLQGNLNDKLTKLVKEVLDHTKPPDNMDRVDDLGSWLATVGWFKRAKRLVQ